VISDMVLKRLTLPSSRHTVHLMAKAAVPCMRQAPKTMIVGDLATETRSLPKIPSTYSIF
jgi:hypothetical protein